MRTLLLVGSLAVVVACSDATGVTTSWVGAWDVQLTNGPGYIISPAASLITLRDSAGGLWAVTPPISVTDSGYSDPVSFNQQFALHNDVARPDSISLRLNAQGMNSGLPYEFRLRGSASGASAQGILTLGLTGDPSPQSLGTWTATKR